MKAYKMSDNRVAPLVGAWIEIPRGKSNSLFPCVAPLVGAWIEMQTNVLSQRRGKVAPLVGAWIEICFPISMSPTLRSLPSWERGLKFCSQTVILLLVHGRSPRGSVD